MDNQQALRRLAEHLAGQIGSDSVVGLGSGSTVAALLGELSPILRERGTRVRGIPTSMQIETVAARNGIALVPFSGSVDFVIDGADQVDDELNLIKGGGGALLKEKVLMRNSGKTWIVAGEEKFVARLGSKGVKVPVEVYPFALSSVKTRLSKMGGTPAERLLQKGYPYYTENGDLILDTGFEPIDRPGELETEIKNVPGVFEVGIFTVKPISACKLGPDGRFELIE